MERYPGLAPVYFLIKAHGYKDSGLTLNSIRFSQDAVNSNKPLLIRTSTPLEMKYHGNLGPSLGLGHQNMALGRFASILPQL